MTVSYCLIQQQQQERMPLRQRWRTQGAGAELELEMIPTVVADYWLGDAGWSEGSGCHQWRTHSAVRQNQTHP